MKESTQQLMLNAEETLNAAEILFKEEYLRDAINRAYYAVFYIAEALLNEKTCATANTAWSTAHLRRTTSKRKYSTRSITNC